jgi:RNA polymerase sigma factor (sigma-70 family)
MAGKGLSTVLEHVYSLAGSQPTRDLSDGQLLHLYCSQHSQEAFAVLLGRHRQLVWNVCRYVLRHHQDAEDAFQATFVVLARKAGSIRKQESLASWLHGVAYRIALRARRDAARRHARDRQAKPMAQDQPVSEKAWNDLQAALTAEVECLPAKLKAPFVLCHLEGKSMAEAAEQLGWKPGTVSGRLTEARKALEKGLARQGVALPAVLTAAALSQGSASAAVPAPVAEGAVKAAALIAAGKGPAAAVSAQAATLARGVLRNMLATRLRFGAVLILALGTAVLGGGTLTYQTLAGGQEQESPQAAQNEPATVPAAGPEQPLVSARVGTDRFRFPGGGDIAPSADGRRALVFQPNDHKPALLVDLPTGKIIRSFKGLPPSSCYRGLALAAKGRAVYCDNNDGLCVLDLSSGKVVQHRDRGLEAVSHQSRVTLSADGRRVAVATGVTWGDGKKAGQVLVYDVAVDKIVADIRIAGFDVRGTALSADGKRVALLAFGVEPQPGPAGKQPRRIDLIEVRDVETGKTLAHMDRSLETQNYGLPASFSPDGKYFAALVWPGVEVWETATGRSVWKDDDVPFTVTALRFTPDGKQLCATQGGGVSAWDAATGKARQQYRFEAAEPHLVFTPDGRWLAVGWRGLVLSTWDVKASKLLTPADGFTWPVTAVRFSPDGREVIAATDAVALARADARSGRHIASISLKPAEDQRPDPVLSARHGPPGDALSPDGRYLAYPTRSRQMALAELATGRVLWTAPLSNSSGITSVVAPVFSPDGSKLSAGGHFDSLQNTSRPSPPIRLWEASSGRLLRGWEPQAGTIAAVAFSPDGSKAAMVAGDYYRPDNRLAAYDLAAGRPLLTATGGFGLWLAFGPDNRTLLMSEENRIVGRDVVTGRVTRSLDFMPRQEAPVEWRRGPRGPFGEVGRLLSSPLTFSPDGRLFAVGTGQPQIRVYEWAGFGERFVLAGHAGPVRALAYSPDGKFLASGSDDTTVLVWDLSRVWKTAPRKAPTTGDTLWARLAGQEAGPAWDALRELASRPELAVALVKERLKPAAPLTVTEADIPALIKRLGAATFAERERASRDLRRLGLRALPLLQEAVKDPPSLEVRRRAEALLNEADRPPPGFALSSRAVELLEQIGGPAAREVLQSLAGGAPGQPLTEGARAALRRMKSRG